MNLSDGIKTPTELREAIEIADAHDENYESAIWAIYKYKLYNWYENIHIALGSPEDKENDDIFNELGWRTDRSIHEAVEAHITNYLDRINSVLDD